MDRFGFSETHETMAKAIEAVKSRRAEMLAVAPGLRDFSGRAPKPHESLTLAYRRLGEVVASLEAACAAYDLALIDEENALGFED